MKALIKIKNGDTIRYEEYECKAVISEPNNIIRIKTDDKVITLHNAEFITYNINI